MSLTETLVRWADRPYQAFAAELGPDLLQGTFWDGERSHLRTARASVPFEHHIQIDVPLPGLMFTRARSPYEHPDGFQFSLRRRTVFTRFMPAPPAGRLGEALGLSSFVVRSSDARRMAALLDDRRVRELLEAHGSIRL